MPPLRDDDTIGSDDFLVRVLHEKWITTDEGRERPNSLAFTDSSQETSCFIDTPANRIQLKSIFAGLKICRFPASIVRAAGFVIERKPDECPEGFLDRTQHVVIGPPELLTKKQLVKRGQTIARSDGVEIISR